MSLIMPEIYIMNFEIYSFKMFNGHALPVGRKVIINNRVL